VAAQTIRAEFPEIGVVILSAHIDVEHALEILTSGKRSGYLLKSRVTDVDEFTATLERIQKGGSVVDPALVKELISTRRTHDPLDVLTPREREVLALMAEGRSNAGIARRLWVTEGTVEKHIHSILRKLDLPETDDDHRRVLAAITFGAPAGKAISELLQAATVVTMPSGSHRPIAALATGSSRPPSSTTAVNRS
jgi:serine/threonine-protein kinase PknK